MRPLTLLLLAFIFFCGEALGQNILHVPSDHPTIQAALNAAGEGDTVLVEPGTYPENITWPNVSGIKLISAGGATSTVIYGEGKSSVLRFTGAFIDSTTVVQGFTITGGGDIAHGGGVFIRNASPTFANVIISGNLAANGAGIYGDNTNAMFRNVVVSGNIASGNGGGIYVRSGSPTFINAIVTGNRSERGRGGGIYTRSRSSFVNTKSFNNQARFRASSSN